MDAPTKLKLWRENPVRFVQDNFDVTPDPWQIDVLMQFAKTPRIAMKACKGPGKTALLSWLSWNFLVTRTYPKIAATSISADNLRDNLWAEMAKWRAKSKLITAMFDWHKERITYKQAPENWFMSFRTWPKDADPSQQANTLAGLHADNLMFVIDEAGGIPESVLAAADAGLANMDSSGHKDAKIIMAGNPTHTSGCLYFACVKLRHLYYVINISSAPDDPLRTPRVSKEWAQQQIDSYGRDNPWVLINVFGEFPQSSINSLLGPDDIETAMRRNVKITDYEHAQKRLGVDVARFGSDSTVLFPRQGLQAFKPVVMRNADTAQIAARVLAAKARWKSEAEFIDGTGGFGSGVVDYMKTAGVPAHEIHASSKPVDARYENRRAEMWFKMAEWVKRGGGLPNEPGLVAELCEPTYTFTNKGKFLIEPKESVKSRLGRSPDLADALCLTFALPDMPSMSSPLRTAAGFEGKALSDWDPFASA